MPENERPLGGQEQAKPEREGKRQEEKDQPSKTEITNLPVKDNMAHNETEGERRFKEGMANNSDTTP